jgi:beta-glucosidase
MSLCILQGTDTEGQWLTDKQQLIDRASRADVVLVGVGEKNYAEAQGNIPDLALPWGQVELVTALASAGKPVVTFLFEGRPRLLGVCVCVCVFENMHSCVGVGKPWPASPRPHRSPKLPSRPDQPLYLKRFTHPPTGSIPDVSDAVLHGYLPGPAGGEAMADILFGKVNPSGRLSFTYPKFQNTPIQVRQVWWCGGLSGAATWLRGF